eukprot:c46417_g1_i1 orf=119-376(-)
MNRTYLRHALLDRNKVQLWSNRPLFSSSALSEPTKSSSYSIHQPLLHQMASRLPRCSPQWCACLKSTIAFFCGVQEQNISPTSSR